jgi:hypothetical protein
VVWEHVTGAFCAPILIEGICGQTVVSSVSNFPYQMRSEESVTLM